MVHTNINQHAQPLATAIAHFLQCIYRYFEVMHIVPVLDHEVDGKR
jgi:hypothetical protein